MNKSVDHPILLDQDILFNDKNKEWSSIGDYSYIKIVCDGDKLGAIVRMGFSELFGVKADSGLSMSVKSGSLVDVDTDLEFVEDDVITLNGHEMIFRPMSDNVYVLFTK